MEFKEKLPVWQNEGVEPPKSKQESGWTAGDQPPADWFNWIHHRTFKALSELRNGSGELYELIKEKADQKDIEEIIKDIPQVFHDAPQSSVTEDMVPLDFKHGITVCSQSTVNTFPTINDYGVTLTVRGANANYAQMFITRHGDVWARRSGIINSWNGEWYNAKSEINEKASKDDLQKINKEVEELHNKTGDLSGLTTEDKSDLVSAINELVDKKQDKPIIYGFEIDESNLNPETAVTYLGSSLSNKPMKVSDYGGWESFVKDISQPVLLKDGKVQYKLQHDDRTKKTDGTSATLTGADGDVMIQFKHLWVKEESLSNNKKRVWISDGEFDGAVSYTKMTEKGYNQLSWGLLRMIQHLYLLLYKNRDSQTALGRGYVDSNDGYARTGTTNSRPYFWGETTGKHPMVFMGIESLWDNKYNWVDGLVSDDNYNLLIGYKDFNDNGNGYKLIKTNITENTYGYAKTTQGGEAGYVLADKAASNSTGYCDYGYLYSGRVARFGGGRSDGSYAGAFYVELYSSASSAYADVGARLCFVDEKHWYIGAYTGYEQNGKLRSISGVEPTDNKTIVEFRTLAKANN